MALGNHLRAKKHVPLTRAEAVKQAVVGRLACSGIGIHTEDTHPVKGGGKLVLCLLRTEAEEGDMVTAAGRAGMHGRGTIAADMAEKAAARAVGMIGQCHAALRAGDRLTASLTAERCAIATAVEEQNGLLAIFFVFGKSLIERA